MAFSVVISLNCMYAGIAFTVLNYLLSGANMLEEPDAA